MHRSQPCWEAVHGGGAEGSGGCSMGSAGCVCVCTGFSVDHSSMAGSGVAGGGSVSGDGGVAGFGVSGIGVSGCGGMAGRNIATGSGASNGWTGLGEPSQSQVPARPAQAQVRVLRSAVRGRGR
jgi:hypothetical protein